MANGTELIRSVQITTSDNQIQDVDQIRLLGQTTGTITAVPEASTLALMGVVVTAAAAGGLFRRARKVVA